MNLRPPTIRDKKKYWSAIGEILGSKVGDPNPGIVLTQPLAKNDCYRGRFLQEMENQMELKEEKQKLAQLTVTPMEKDIKEKTQIKHMQTKSKRKEGEGLPDNLFPSQRRLAFSRRLPDGGGVLCKERFLSYRLTTFTNWVTRKSQR